MGFVVGLAMQGDLRRWQVAPVNGGKGIGDGEHAIDRCLEVAGKLAYYLVNPKGTISQQIHEPKLSAYTPVLKQQLPTLKKFKVEIKENKGQLQVYDEKEILRAQIRLSYDKTLSAAHDFGTNI